MTHPNRRRTDPPALPPPHPLWDVVAALWFLLAATALALWAVTEPGEVDAWVRAFERTFVPWMAA